MKGNPANDAVPAVTMSGSLGRLLRLTRKELSESLRDRRTILTLVLMPVLLYPLLTIAFQKMLLARQVDQLKPVYRIGFASREEGDSLLAYWKVGQAHRIHRHAPSTGKDKPPPLAAYLDPQPDLATYFGTDLDEAVSTGKLDVAVRLRPEGAFRAEPGLPLRIECDLIYREGSTKGREAVQHLELLTAEANAVLVDQVLHAAGLPQRGDPVRVRASTAPDAADKKSLFPVLVPLILILMTMTGAVYPAIDLTAGERERGTLEILVAAPIPRLSVLLAKYFAVFTVAMLTALVNVGAMAVTLRVTGIEEALFGVSIGFVVLIQVLALLLLFAAFFSAVLLTLTSFAHSFKEAQAYLVPLMLLCMTPGMMALMPGLSLRGPLAVVPLINIVLLSRDVFEGAATLTTSVVVVMTTLLYAVAAVGLAARIFGAEAVLSNEVSGWGDVFRRPARPRPSAEPSGALLCLALMFPVYFLLTTGLARIGGLDAAGRLGLTALANVGLFVGFPLVAAWRGRVQLQSSLRLYVPGWQACAVAVLLGTCLWPFAHEVILLLRQAGIATFQGESMEKVREFLAECRTYSPWLIVAVLALIPAVVEELFFRGFLFTALLGKGDHPGQAILASAALFAAFHLLVTDGLAVERLLPSLLLGVVLAGLCYKSGSIVPGMILHALHNGLLVLMAYYEPWLSERGWMPSAEDHLPAWLLAGAAVGAGLGLVWLWRLRPLRRPEEVGE